MLTVSCNNYYTRTIKDIYLKIPKSVCKNIVMHKKETSDKNSSLLSAYFNIRSYDKQPVKLEISHVMQLLMFHHLIQPLTIYHAIQTPILYYLIQLPTPCQTIQPLMLIATLRLLPLMSQADFLFSPDDALTSKKLLSDADIITLFIQQIKIFLIKKT